MKENECCVHGHRNSINCPKCWQREAERLRDERDAEAHVIIAHGIIPGEAGTCRCELCRSVAERMDEAGYLDAVTDRWWDYAADTAGGKR